MRTKKKVSSSQIFDYLTIFDNYFYIWWSKKSCVSFQHGMEWNLFQKCERTLTVLKIVWSKWCYEICMNEFSRFIINHLILNTFCIVMEFCLRITINVFGFHEDAHTYLMEDPSKCWNKYVSRINAHVLQCRIYSDEFYPVNIPKITKHSWNKYFGNVLLKTRENLHCLRADAR